MLQSLTHWRENRNLTAMERAGALVMAGGEGTRLGHRGPKGTYPVGPGGESLFAILAAKTPKHRPLGIMTSRLTHDATVRHFEEREFFGLERVHFFRQGMTQAGPEGNGTLLHHFWKSGVADTWTDVDVITIQPVDNALAHPFDARMLDCEEVVIKATERLAGEQAGLLVQEGDRVRVVEYSELQEERAGLANLSLFAVTKDFSRLVAERTEEMPWHEAHKKGQVRQEKFIFDMLAFARRVKILVCPREECFAPLKCPEDVPRVRALVERQWPTAPNSAP